jgi:GTP-binding protein Era
MTGAFRSGFVAIVGRPNVGKSTLLNRLVGQKVSITSRRPQTTRHRILGIRTLPDAQIAYVDTPGLHPAEGRAINRTMNQAARTSLADVDCILFVITSRGLTAADQPVLEMVRARKKPVILVINKVDLVANRDTLLPLIESLKEEMTFADIIPLSARTGTNVEPLEQAILRQLPEGQPYFPDDQVSDRSERFLAAELIREQLFHSMGAEVPYAIAVEINRFQDQKRITRIEATIWVEKDGQKAILIGTGGSRLKGVGRAARLEMEKLFGRKIFLQLWVKVREGWSDDLRALRSLGYAEDS